MRRPVLTRLKLACARYSGRLTYAQILELEIMADAADVSAAAAALSTKLAAFVSQSNANYTDLQTAQTAASALGDQAVSAINAVAANVPDVATIGGAAPTAS